MLRAGLAMSELNPTTLWVSYLTVGGTMTSGQVTEVLRGQRDISAHEHNLLSQALNDDFTDHGLHHPVPYAEDVAADQDRPVHGTRHR